MNVKKDEYLEIIDALYRELIVTKIALEEASKLLNGRQTTGCYIKKENSDNVYKPTGVDPIISQSISYFFGGIFK